MRILHVITAADADGGYGGPLSVALAQAAAMRARGHRVDVVSTHGDGPPRTDVEGLTTFPSRTWSAAFAFSSRTSAGLRHALHERMSGADVVQVHFAREIIPVRALRAAARAGVPAVSQPHGTFTPDGRALYRAVDRFAALPAARSARLQIALNAWERDRLVALGLPAASIRIVPNAAPALHGDRGVGRPPTVAFVSRLHPRKRVLAFAAMAAQLLAEGGLPEGTRFAIHGPDSGDLPALEQQLAALPAEIRQRISYLGALRGDEVAGVLAAAGAFVLPSVDEPFGMALLEAMSAGVPSVCTDSCRLSDLVTAHGAGEVATPEPASLAAAVRRILTDPGHAHRLVAGADAMIESELSSAVVADALEAVYREAAGG